MGWRIVHAYGDYTTKAFTDISFEYQRSAYGQKEPEDPWEFCYSVTDNNFHYAVGRLYIDNYFGPSARSDMGKLIREIKTAFSEELNKQDWMDVSTKNKAKEKVISIIIINNINKN